MFMDATLDAPILTPQPGGPILAANALPQIGQKADHPLRPIHRPPEAQCRMICFPGAGASAGYYRFWRDFGGERAGIEVLAYQPRGREDRFRLGQPRLSDSVQEATTLLADQTSRDGKGLVLFGHSYGALIAHEVAQGLRTLGIPVRALCVAGRAAPHLAPWSDQALTKSDEDLAQAMRRIGLEDRDILSHPAIGHIFLRGLRNDLAENERHVACHAQPLDCPILAFSGQQDPIAPPLSVAAWATASTGPFAHHRLRGGHFFPAPQARRLATLITASLERLP